MKVFLKSLLKHFAVFACFFVIMFLSFYRTGSQGSDIFRRQQSIEKHHPSVLFLGNSLTRAGIDEKLFQEQTHLRALKATSNGSASAWWFLYIKNVCSQVRNKPKYLVICFRDHFLTYPHFRTQGMYRKPLRSLAQENEQLFHGILNNKSLNTKSVQWEKPLEWLPLEVKEAWDRRITKIAAKVARVHKDRQELALSRVFDDSKMQKNKLSKKQMQSEILDEEKYLCFSEQIQHSFLPFMLKELKDSQVNLLLVRLKRRNHCCLSYKEPEPLQKYIEELKHYLSQQEVAFLDLSRSKDIQEEHYGPGDHLNGKGKEILTGLISQFFNSHLQL